MEEWRRTANQMDKDHAKGREIKINALLNETDIKINNVKTKLNALLNKKKEQKLQHIWRQQKQNRTHF